MPKNAVQRLQKIDKDIKTVLSIFDVANTSKEKNGESQTQKDRKAMHFPKISPSKCWQTDRLLDKLNEQSGPPPSHLFDTLKQIGSFIPEPDKRLHSSESVLANIGFKTLRKPNSAPSSSSTFSTICEPRHKWEQSSDSVPVVLENPLPTQANPSKSSNVLDWMESSNLSQGSDPFLTPSKTLLTANEILTRNNYATANDNVSEAENPVNFCDLVPFVLENIIARDENAGDEGKAKATVDRLLGPRESPPTTKLSATESRRNIQKEKIFPGRLPVSAIPKRTSKLEKPESSNSKNRTTLRGKPKESTERQEKSWSFDKCEARPAGNQRKEGSLGRATSFAGNRLGVKNEKNSGGEKVEKRVGGVSDRERKVQNPKSSDSQRLRKSPEVQGLELRTSQLTKILERNNEKLEKMKMSKDLALDIAKQLKDKYEEIQQSREGLMEKLQNVEKDNEKLHGQVKKARDSKMKLELTMEGLKDSQTKLQEQEHQTQELRAENAWLRVKIVELENQISKKLLAKRNQIEQFQKERLSEIRKELKHREHQVGDVQRLAREKTELATKIDDLRGALKERQTTVESQEVKIHQLEEEVQRQNQYLRKKTERLEETNKELESIKKKSTDLEEQLKTLRKNIDNFDAMHKNLMKQTVDYENQIKTKEEQIQTLQSDNVRLKKELENDKDALLIKTKIIENQQDTIKQLREKAEGAKALLKRNQSLERILNVERDEKLELHEAVERLKCRKEELKGRIKSLESDLLLAPQEVVKDLQKTQMVLHELENQVQIKQKEWELHLQSLIREKEQACSVAEFATKKLMQTTSEFQKQSEAHKRLHRVLAENLAEKERHLREVNEKLAKK